MKTYYTYILTNTSNSTIYIGVTNNIIRRMFEHKNHLVPGFTDRYNCTKLVYYQEFADINEAISKEKSLKGKVRKKKIELIELNNPKWKDLSDGWGIPVMSHEKQEEYRKNLTYFNKTQGI